MPWWAYRAWQEGLAWEEPWMPAVQMLEAPEGAHRFEEPAPEIGDTGPDRADSTPASADELRDLGLNVRQV